VPDVVAGRAYARVYRTTGRADLHEFLVGAVVCSGGRLLYSSSPQHAPVYFGIQTPSDERVGVLVYPFRATVDGDYWHSCPAHGRKTPFAGPNARLWEEKMLRNQERDRKATRIAQELGWTVIRLWECTIRADPDNAALAVLQHRDLPPVD
jgi:hypothetical protein